jgi:hypothetical protein
VGAVGAEVVPARLRDRDAIFGTAFDARVDNLGIRQLARTGVVEALSLSLRA